MTQMIFVNLPVRDLAASRHFCTSLGFSVNEAFSDDTAFCVVISDAIRDSRADADAIMTAALGAGGSEPRPVQELGFMYSRAFADPDGHIWETMWMDPAAAAGGTPDI